jgi:hypothetical protein
VPRQRHNEGREDALNELYDIAEANALIDEGRVLHIAGDAALLDQLHRGSWIGGTTPYILTRQGGIAERTRVFVSELPARAGDVTIRFVDIGHIPVIATEAPRNGFTIVIAPGMSDIHTTYGLTANSIPGIREIPIIGWISGVHADDRGRLTPKVFNGRTGEASENRIVLMRVALPASKQAVVGIINLFEPGAGDEIVFHAPSFSVKECLVNGKPEDFYAYAVRKALDVKLPLVTELGGEFINVSFKAFDAESHSVQFYAPVMQGRVYRQAAAVPDYRAALVRVAEQQNLTPVLSCNCYHNYTYGGLEGEQFIPLPGPAVFGELAHVLMNQTLVCLSVKNK